MTPQRSQVLGSLSRVDDIEVGYDVNFHRRWYRFAQSMRLLAVLLILGGVIRAFGRGSLSHASGRSPDGVMRLEYERLLRAKIPALTTVECTRLTGDDEVWRLTLRGDHQQSRIEQVVPRPFRMSASDDVLTMTSRAPGAQTARVTFLEEPLTPAGLARGEVRIETSTGSSERIRIWQRIYA